MYGIKENVTNKYIINKSIFICKLIKIDSDSNIKEIINDLKKEYKDATHYCFAYICGSVKRFNDDGEPGGTAGMPILNVLENNNLDNILCVVIRYFGGIKLGAGGLVRAYTKAVTSALDKTKISKLIPATVIEIIFNYDSIKTIDNILRDEIIINKDFNDLISYTINISNDKLNELINELKLYTVDIKIIKNNMISK